MVQSFLFKFYAYTRYQLNQSDTDLTDSSIASPYCRPVSHAQQTIPEPPKSQKVVGTSLPHQSGYLQATGEAQYVDDIPSIVNTLHAAFVISKKPNARIKNIGMTSQFFFSILFLKIYLI